MRVLIVGSGAREHALTWKALQSPLATDVFCAPGNAATAAIAVNMPVMSTDPDGLARLVCERSIDLTIIGPDAAVAAGVADRIQACGGAVFGPTAAAGRIETSKAFAKQLMVQAGVPTPPAHVFSDPASARDYVRSERRAFVVKADGLAKGKGSIVPDGIDETLEAIDTLMVARTVGHAANLILLEEKLTGQEVSLMALVDGQRVVPLAAACDYKRALDGDQGPNTGGMGGYSPVPYFTEDDAAAAVGRILQPVVDALRAAGSPYRGCLYAGLMVTDNGVQALEFNARFGDPEAQVVLPRVVGDLLPSLMDAATGRLSADPVRWSDRASVGVVLASHGYPGSFRVGHPIEGLSRLEGDVFLFHAGTSAGPDGYRTAAGRVLTLVALDGTLAAARERAYRNAGRITFEGVSYRRDIAMREVEAVVRW